MHGFLTSNRFFFIVFGLLLKQLLSSVKQLAFVIDLSSAFQLSLLLYSSDNIRKAQIIVVRQNLKYLDLLIQSHSN